MPGMVAARAGCRLLNAAHRQQLARASAAAGADQGQVAFVVGGPPDQLAVRQAPNREYLQL